MSYSGSQLVALAIVPKITSSVSIPTWAAPKGTPDTPFAAGTTQSCTFQGFLLQLAIGAPFYNCLLALLYLLTVRYGWREERLRKVEYICHAAILLFAIGTGLALIPLGMYNHIGSVCWVIGLPQGCGSSNYGSSSEASVPCERGDHAWLYGVKATESRSNRYSGGPRTRSRANDVKMQALLYCCAFYLSWLPSTLWSITQWCPTTDALQQQLKWDILTLVTCGLCRGPSDNGADDDALDPSSHRTASGDVAMESTKQSACSQKRFSLMSMNSPTSFRSSRGSNGDISLPGGSDATAKESSAELQTQKARRVSSLGDVVEDEDVGIGRKEGAQEDDWRDDKA
ncbi:hypothetical protein ACHAXT_009631 [Thalassiosira profunda]